MLRIMWKKDNTKERSGRENSFGKLTKRKPMYYKKIAYSIGETKETNKFFQAKCDKIIQL